MIKKAFQFKQFKHSIQVYLVAVAEEGDNLGTVKRSAPSPTRPVEALEPAPRYVASPAQEVFVVERRIQGRVGTLAASLLSQGRGAARVPFMNSVSL